MNDHQDQNATAQPRTRRRWLAAFGAAAVIGTLVGAGVSHADGLFNHHRMAAHAAMDPAALDKHIDAMVALMGSDASPEQRAKIAAIAKAAAQDLRPLHEQFAQSHGRAHALLIAPVIDRRAMEQLRLEHVQQFDTASKRLMTALIDSAEVLTPEQRAKVGEQIRAHHQ